MNIINLKKMWKSVIAKTHKTKPNKTNLLKREALLTLQTLLGQYELAMQQKNEGLVGLYANILEIYEKHGINGYIAL